MRTTKIGERPEGQTPLVRFGGSGSRVSHDRVCGPGAVCAQPYIPSNGLPTECIDSRDYQKTDNGPVC